MTVMHQRDAWTRRHVSRRGVLGGALAGSAGLAAFGVACSSTKSAAPGAGKPAAGASSSAAQVTAAAAQQPRRGGTLVHQNGFETIQYGFDPQILAVILGAQYRIWYQGLLGYNTRTYAIEPEIAQKWEQPDQATTVFHLQSNVKWHNKPPANGRLLTADDVVFSLNRARSNDPRFTSGPLLKDYQFTATDQATVKVTAPSPEVTGLQKFAGDQFMMLAPEVVDKAGKFASADTCVGTGAFVLQSATDGVGSASVRNPDYWKPGLPYLDGFHTQHFDTSPLTEKAWAAFQAGQLDTVVVPGNETKGYIAKQPKGYTPEWWKNNAIDSIMFPNTKAKPFDDARVTRGMELLVDHQEFITAWAETLYGAGQYVSVFPVALADWDFTQDEYKSKFLGWKQPKDDAVKQALQLLGAAGFSKDNPVKFEFIAATESFSLAAAQLIQGQWKRLGQGYVDATLRTVESTQYQSIRANRQYQYLGGSNAAAFNDPDTWLTNVYKTGVARNYWNYSDPRLDALIDKQHVTFDLAQRKQQVKDIIAYMIDHWPSVIHAGNLVLDANKPSLQNHAPEFYMLGRPYEQVWFSA
jgi:peptide/nickel transport system substrate-binding protein